MGWQLYFGDKITARKDDAKDYNKVVIRARSGDNAGKNMQLSFIDVYGAAYTATVSLNNNMQEIEVPLANFKSGASLLLPRPYPGFLPLWFNSGGKYNLQIGKLDKLELRIGTAEREPNETQSVEVQWIYLSK